MKIIIPVVVIWFIAMLWVTDMDKASTLKDSSSFERNNTTYRYDYIVTPKGDPCIVVRGGSHSGIAGVSCDWSRP